MPLKGSGTGLRLNQDGYLEIVRRGPLRWQKAHRAYVNRQLRESRLPELTADEEVHHLCRHRACWPPSDYHLLILPASFHAAIDGGSQPSRKRRHRMNKNIFESREKVLDNEIASA